MMVQDSLTGYVHEVPELSEAPAYDGFGNPLGFLGRRRRRGGGGGTPAPAAEPGMGPILAPEGDEMGEVAYDGLGNPVGFLNPFKAIGSAVRNVGRIVASPFRILQGKAPFPGGLLPFAAGGLLPGLLARIAGIRRNIQQHQASGRPVPPSLFQALNNLMAQQRRVAAFRRPWPMGWRRPSLPYTGLGPRRLYMRCAVWPGPRALVPAHAAAMPTQMQQIAQQAAMRAAGMMGGRRRGRGRRRR